MYRMMTLALLVALAACAKAPKGPGPSYRDAGLNLYSNAVFDPNRALGDWQQVASFTKGNDAPCTPGTTRFSDYSAASNNMSVATELCLAGQKVVFNGKADFRAAGRFALSGADPQGIGEPWWVIWVDTDYRTMAIGTPSGRFGFILNRGGALPQDRMTAAREILAWNGYNVVQLQRF